MAIAILRSGSAARRLRLDFGARDGTASSAPRAVPRSARRPPGASGPRRPGRKATPTSAGRLIFTPGCPGATHPEGRQRFRRQERRFRCSTDCRRGRCAPGTFGDGSALLNAHMSSISQSARITPLDAALTDVECQAWNGESIRRACLQGAESARAAGVRVRYAGFDGTDRGCA
jgi:hypothetical protein